MCTRARPLVPGLSSSRFHTPKSSQSRFKPVGTFLFFRLHYYSCVFYMRVYPLRVCQSSRLIHISKLTVIRCALIFFFFFTAFLWLPLFMDVCVCFVGTRVFIKYCIIMCSSYSYFVKCVNYSKN